MTANPWLACPELNPQAGLRLFCFPYAGGNSTIFRNWPEKLPQGVEVCPVQMPGRIGRLKEAPFTRLSPLIEAVSRAILADLDKPFALFGHSMGALICFELARHLRREHGLEPVQIFVSAHRAPHLDESGQRVYDLPEDELIAFLRRISGTPKEVLEHPELMQLVIPIIRADFELIQTYEYQSEPPLDCPISAFMGIEDPDVTVEQMEAWCHHTTGAFAVRTFPGDHFYLNSAQPLLLGVLWRELQHRLSEL